ncbi:hypothetical protein F4553_000368 [Allocatelliglobosispora scoriae]|uniref:Ig-like domain-containing protein n=1 Tax=Allocatelliglobosispora scoriae TaxID=643052 RepID=A0A841BIJ2_9ACTN|nr:hypothetical protein [Allocatelliglobosispora scoriae]MBB5866989.1 hypothetical protein [Allocatelliglobosispora scoriae]
MTRSLRTAGLVATAALLAAAGLVPASPAHAAALTVDVSCESLGHYAVLCERTIAGGVAPFKTRWYYNGNYFAGQDDKAFTSWSCTLSGPNSYKATVTDAVGASATDTSGVGCRSGNP